MGFPDFFSNFLRTELLPNDMSIMDMVPISKKPSGSSHPKHLDHFSIDCPNHFPIDVPTIFPSFSHLNCHIFPLSGCQGSTFLEFHGSSSQGSKVPRRLGSRVPSFSGFKCYKGLSGLHGSQGSKTPAFRVPSF